MSMKWHPDKNPGLDVTATMQDINEAYAILKDDVKRVRYDEEYFRFRKTFFRDDNDQDCVNSEFKSKSYSEWTYAYNVHDEILKEYINNAREYAKGLVDRFLKEVKTTSHTAAKGAVANALYYALAWVLGGILISLSGGVIKACS